MTPLMTVCTLIDLCCAVRLECDQVCGHDTALGRNDGDSIVDRALKAAIYDAYEGLKLLPPSRQALAIFTFIDCRKVFLHDGGGIRSYGCSRAR